MTGPNDVRIVMAFTFNSEFFNVPFYKEVQNIKVQVHISVTSKSAKNKLRKGECTIAFYLGYFQLIGMYFKCVTVKLNR